jgi:hypothetical protein
MTVSRIGESPGEDLSNCGDGDHPDLYTGEKERIHTIRRRRKKNMKQMAILGVLLVILAVSVPAVAGEKGHGEMQGMFAAHHMKDHGSMSGMHGESKTEGHGMMKMGDKVFEGKAGPWKVEARLVDMKAQMAKSKVSEKMMAKMKHTHHVMFSLEDPEAKKLVTEGKGTVTVTGPDKKEAKYDLVGMQGHFGADITLDEAGKYGFSAEIESGGKKGTASFHHTIK